MTNEELFKVLPVLEAVEAGKTIQVRVKEAGAVWNDYSKGYPTHWGKFEYRVKPELEYRPFMNGEECWAEMQKHQPFGWISNVRDCYEFVHKVGNGHFYLTDKALSYKDSYCYYTFADGTPFGIKTTD